MLSSQTHYIYARAHTHTHTHTHHAQCTGISIEAAEAEDAEKKPKKVVYAKKAGKKKDEPSKVSGYDAPVTGLESVFKRNKLRFLCCVMQKVYLHSLSISFMPSRTHALPRAPTQEEEDARRQQEAEEAACKEQEAAAAAAEAAKAAAPEEAGGEDWEAVCVCLCAIVCVCAMHEMCICVGGCSCNDSSRGC